MKILFDRFLSNLHLHFYKEINEHQITDSSCIFIIYLHLFRDLFFEILTLGTAKISSFSALEVIG